MASLNRIEVEGFKSIRKMDLELRPMNILIGANGAGKSNFVSVFTLLNQIPEQNLQSFVKRSGGSDALLHFGQKVTGGLTLRLYFASGKYEAILKPGAEDTLFFAEENIDILGMHIEPNEGLPTMESSLNRPNIHPFIQDTLIVALKGCKVYHFHDTTPTARVKLTGDIHDNAVLRPDASNLAAMLYLFMKTQRDYYDRIVSTTRLAAPFFADFELRPAPENSNTILLRWRQKDSDIPFGAYALSDGTLRFICLTTLLMQPDLPPLVIIDEPELGLHPYAIVLLASMLKSAATKTQVVVSTQSVPLVNQFTPEDLIVVEQSDGQSVFKRLETKQLEDWLEDYALGEIWEKNLIGGTP